MENNLPGGQALTNWETVAHKNNFVSSLSTFYIKSDFATTNKRFIAHYPNIVLGFLPLGFNNKTFSLKQISWVNINVSYKLLKILIGIIAILFWLGSGEFWIMILGIIVWLVFFSLGTQVSIAVTTSGQVTYCPIVFWEKGKATQLVNNLNSVIAENC